MDRDQQQIIKDLLENTRKTDRNAIFLAVILAVQTIMVAYLENRISGKIEECSAIIGLVNESD